MNREEELKRDLKLESKTQKVLRCIIADIFGAIVFYLLHTWAMASIPFYGKVWLVALVGAVIITLHHDYRILTGKE